MLIHMVTENLEYGDLLHVRKIQSHIFLQNLHVVLRPLLISQISLVAAERLRQQPPDKEQLHGIISGEMLQEAAARKRGLSHVAQATDIARIRQRINGDALGKYAGFVVQLNIDMPADVARKLLFCEHGN